jgi:ABC-2 type transport system ATP-binding protein
MTTTIRIQGLTKRYGAVNAVDDLTFSPATGRVTGFLGPNGAGKSTTMRILLGLAAPTAGTATIDGKAYAQLRQPLRHIGAVLDPNIFHPGRRGLDALRVVARTHAIPSARVHDVLAQVDLESAGRRRVGGYSLGMRQRLALAVALLGEPGTLLLDEPANGLDPEGVRWLRLLIRELAADGRTVLVSSHQLAELAQTVDDVVIINRGRLVTHEPMRDLLDRQAGSLEDIFLGLTKGEDALPSDRPDQPIEGSRATG